MNNGPTYTDENGKTLYGFSVIDQKQTVKWLKYLTLVLFAFLILCIFLLIYIMYNDIWTESIKIIGGCI